MRLQRALARAGVASRRASEDLIRRGAVTVNGLDARLGMVVDPSRDRIMVAGRTIRPSRVSWIALHKPVGYVVSRRDRDGRPTIFELVPELPGLTYVGRLDVLTSGLLLLTTDGERAHRLTHPRFAVERSYRVTVRGRPSAWLRDRLARPVIVGGRPVALRRLRVVGHNHVVSVLHLTLTEGRNRIVRRLCNEIGLVVDDLVRTAHGPVRLGRLGVGRWRGLTHSERRIVTA